MSDALDTEIKPFGLRSICFEPGYFRTSFLADNHRGHGEARIPDYQELVNFTNTRLASMLLLISPNCYPTTQRYLDTNGKQPGDPKKAAQVIVDVVRKEGIAAGRETPSVVVLGSDAYGIIKGICEGVIQRLETWKDVTCSTDLPK